MMVSKCNGGCGNQVGWAFAAQYRAVVPEKEFGQEIILCSECWKRGVRMWVNKDGAYSVGTECPNDFWEAMLYYDEGSYVTGRNWDDMTYPDIKQPQREV